VKKLVVISVILTAFAHGIAYGSHQRVTDANDSPGILDIKRVDSFGLVRPARRIITYKPWTANAIYDEGNFLIFYDTALDERFDYYVMVRSNGRKMEGILWRDYKKAPDEIVGDAQVWRPNLRAVVARISLNQLWISKGRENYRWMVQSLKWDGPSCINVCFDRAPENNVVVEPLPPDEEPDA
jgi:hypothetical protein